MNVFRGGFHPLIIRCFKESSHRLAPNTVYTKVFSVYTHFMVHRKGSLCSDFVKDRMRADKPLMRQSEIKNIQMAKGQKHGNWLKYLRRAQ